MASGERGDKNCSKWWRMNSESMAARKRRWKGTIRQVDECVWGDGGSQREDKGNCLSPRIRAGITGIPLDRELNYRIEGWLLEVARVKLRGSSRSSEGPPRGGLYTARARAEGGGAEAGGGGERDDAWRVEDECCTVSGARAGYSANP